MLQIICFRDDYKKLIELSIILLYDNLDEKLKIYHPGVIHQVCWMSWAIYCLKIYILWKPIFLIFFWKNAINMYVAFIIQFYVKAWWNYTMPVKIAANDLNCIKDLILYEKEH